MSLQTEWIQGVIEEVAEAIPPAYIPEIRLRLQALEDRLQLHAFVLQMASPQGATRPARLLDAVRVVADLVREPGRVEEVRQEDVGAILMVIAGLETALAARIMTVVTADCPGDKPVDDDRLLTVDEAAALLKVTPRWLYQRASRLPFTRRLSRKALRFSEAGIRRWIATKRTT